MKRLLTSFLVLSVFAMPAGAVEKCGGTEADYAEIQAFHDTSIRKFNAGDLEGSLADYLERLRVLHTQRTTITGRTEMRESWSKSFASAATRPYLVSEIQEMEVQGGSVGSWAYMVCRYASAALDKTTGAIKGDVDNGRYIALMVKTAQGWKVLLDIDNGAAGAAPDLAERLKKEVAK
jgi:ketosteroid isomerase-like protein